jgi:uncharacterized protein YbbC (DUF1343 family)
LERILDEPLPALKGKRVGVLVNSGAVDRAMRPAVDALIQSGHMIVDRLFAGEHGLYGEQPAGAPIGDASDPRTDRPLVSLYGRPSPLTPEHASGLDAVIIDVMDIGCRSYTVLGTALELMAICKAASVPVYVLDRPNPIGARVEGPPIVKPHLQSLIGSADIPLRHGLTIGELVRLAADERKLSDGLEVVPMEGWSRSALWSELGRPWAPPSPHADDWNMARLFPGTCLFQGTNISEGRGTAMPFQVLGAPWLDCWVVATEAAAEAPEGVYFRPLPFLPTYSKHAGVTCQGVMVHLDPRFDTPIVEPALHLLASMLKHPLTEFWSTSPDRPRHVDFDVRAGDEQLRTDLSNKRPVADIVAAWVPLLADWRERTAEYVLYGRL